MTPGDDTGRGSFVILEAAEPSPVVVEIPHAGLDLDAETLAWIVAPARSVAREADLYVDRLFAEAPSLGATTLVAHGSRFAMDLNRAEDDYDGDAVVGGPPGDRPRGAIWRLTSDGLPVHSERISREELERRAARYWRPYHAALIGLLEERRARFGHAVLLCAHSMPSPRSRGLRGLVPPRGADVVPGTQGRTTAAPAWIDLVERVAREHGLEVEHDTPYRGGYSTTHYGRPAAGVHAVQLELARRLYMDERTLSVDKPGFARVRDFAGALVRNLVDEARRVYGSGAPHEARR